MEDLISQLPNELVHKILLNLTTRESVRTSVLSTRWRHLWQSVPGLIFDGDERDVTNFLEKFLNLHKELPIDKFILKFSNVDIPCLKLLIDQVLSRRVQRLDMNGLKCFRKIKLPISFYTCETLVNLHLVNVTLDNFDGIEFIDLPRLQVMHLRYVSIMSDVVLEMLISCSSVLQELSLYDMEVGRVTVRSQVLRRLCLNNICWSRLSDDGGESRVVIDTPNLEFLSIKIDHLKNFRVESVSSSIKICIGILFDDEDDDNSKMQTLHTFFAGISRVTALKISGRTLYKIYDTCFKVLQHQQLLPEFKNLTCFYAFFFESNILEMLPLFLSRCPNLKSIDLEFCGYPDMKEITNLPVPQCVQTSIEDVKLRIMPMFDQERSPKAKTEFAKYILENASALKKLTLWLDEEEDVCNSVREQILTFRNSPCVEVKIHRTTRNYRLDYMFVGPKLC